MNAGPKGRCIGEGVLLIRDRLYCVSSTNKGNVVTSELFCFDFGTKLWTNLGF